MVEGSINCRRKEGKPVATRAIFRNVTKQKQAEQELQKSEQRFRATFERAGVGIVQLSSTGKFLRANPQFCQIVGYSEEELLQKTFMDISYPAKHLERDFQLVQQILAGEIETFSYQKRYLHKNGSRLWVHLSVSSVKTHRGEVDYLIGVIADISQQKIAEEKLNNILNSMEDLVWSVNPDTGEVIYMNPAVERVYQRSKAEFSRHRNLWLEVVHPKDRPRVQEHYLRMSRTGSQDLEYRIVQPSGEVRWLRDRANIIYNPAGKPLRIDGIATDITRSKQAEEDLRKAYEKEKELNELKTEFIDIASHEFRTPLTTIVGSAEFLAHYYDQLTSAKRYKHVNNIQVAGHRIDRLIDDVLAISKADSGKLQLNLQPLALESFCSNLIEPLLLGIGQDHQLNFVNLGLCSEEIYLDAELLEHILNNLLSNAFKYSPIGSQVDFTIQQQEEQVIFEIADQGIGIPSEDQVHLFSSFHRGKNVGDLPGTGLGLNIVKKYVELHGGEISFTSHIGIGTTFKVIIPQPQLTKAN